MAKVYLDTNKVFDIALREPVATAQIIEGHEVFVSPLSYHILYYTEGVDVPDKNLADALSEFEIVDFSKKVLDDALEGPTKDLEDNVQLHSAAEKDCDYFLTNDKGLLKMKFFGKTRIVDSLI